MISEIRKITLQIRLFMIFVFHLMLWKTLHLILTPQAIHAVAKLCLISHRNDSYNPYFEYSITLLNM